MKKTFVALILVVVAALAVGLFATRANSQHQSDVATYTVYTYDLDLASGAVTRISTVQCRGLEAAVRAVQIAASATATQNEPTLNPKLLTHGITIVDTHVRASNRSKWSKTTAATQRTRAVRTSFRS